MEVRLVSIFARLLSKYTFPSHELQGLKNRKTDQVEHRETENPLNLDQKDSDNLLTETNAQNIPEPTSTKI